MIKAISVYPFSEKGIRENNEDAIASVNDRYFTVCDGMGGHGHGEVAGQTVAESLSAFFQALSTTAAEKSNLQAALDYAIERLNEKDIYGDSERKMGTTVVLAALTEYSVLVGHVGDSRLYHIRQGAGLLFRTKDHSQVQEWIDAEIITEEEARTHPKKNLITRCVQPNPTKSIVLDINELTGIQTGDYLFLCTDGVTDAMSDTEITGIISSYIPDDEKANRIKEACAARSKDNYSGFLMKIEAEIASCGEEPYSVFNNSKGKKDENGEIPRQKVKVNLSNNAKFCSNCGNKITDRGKTDTGEWLNKRFFKIIILIISVCFLLLSVG